MSVVNKRWVCDCQPAWWGWTELKFGSSHLADDDNNGDGDDDDDEDDARRTASFLTATSSGWQHGDGEMCQEGVSGGRQGLWCVPTKSKNKTGSWRKRRAEDGVGEGRSPSNTGRLKRLQANKPWESESLKIWILTAESYCYYFREKTKYDILSGFDTDPPGRDFWEVSEVVSDGMNQTGESSQITTNTPLLNSCFAVHLHGVVFPCGRISRPTLDPLRDSWDDTFLQMAHGGRWCFLSAWRHVIVARKFKLLGTGEL